MGKCVWGTSLSVLLNPLQLLSIYGYLLCGLGAGISDARVI